MFRTVASWSESLLGVDDAEGGNGGRSPFADAENFVDDPDDPDPRRAVDSEEPRE